MAGVCDAAVVGGVDSLCLTTLYGFNSLQLISADICRPADSARTGISIGEAGGFALLDPPAESPLALLGYGETSDAYHMSLPEPGGRGAIESMRAALERASAAPHEVDYINLHGTGTIANDNAESRAVCDVFGSSTPCSSTKGWTGHTLGAAGMVEAAISLMAIEHGLMPRSLNTRVRDPAIEAGILLENRVAPVRRVLSNSFGFGGSNCSLLFGSCAVNAVFIEAVGLAAPGLPSWLEGRATLSGERPYVDTPLPPHTPSMLPLNERRRATPADQTGVSGRRRRDEGQHGGRCGSRYRVRVFGRRPRDHSSHLSRADRKTQRLISPTDFHNSVHNAAAGYWSIAAGARAASTTISAHDGSFGAGLLEACSQVLADGCDVLLVAFDLPAPEPLNATRFIACPAAVAFVLTRQATTHSLAALTCATTG